MSALDAALQQIDDVAADGDLAANPPAALPAIDPEDAGQPVELPDGRTIYVPRLHGRRVDERVSCVLFPGSMQTAVEIARAGYLADLLAAGVVVSEPTCGACPGYVHVPATGVRSIRS